MSLFLNCKFLSLWIYVLIVLFDVGFYCDIFTNLHATLLVFIVIIILITVTVQCFGNFNFNSIVFLKTVWNLDIWDYDDLCEYKSNQMISTILVYHKIFCC